MLEWMLQQVMKDRGIRSGAELMRLLQEKAGYRLSPPSMSALLTQQPKQMKRDTLDALCAVLDCTPGELWVYKPTNRMKGA